MTDEQQYDIPLELVTPHVTGQKVRDAQWLMKGNNRFVGLAPYKDGEIDGDYGPLSAQATARTKYWIGYPQNAVDGSFGQTLYEYLRPLKWRPLPSEYRDRRDARLKAAAETIGSKALEIAITQIGYKEQRDSRSGNINKYGKWYGMDRVAWCAIFDSWCFDQSGYKNFKYSYVPFVAADAIANRNRLSIVRTPRYGDLALHTINGVPDEHISFFEKWIDEAAGTFYDVGGNTGPSSISNGGAVMRQVRDTHRISRFVRVN